MLSSSTGTKWKSGQDRLLLTLATRALPASRAVLNEAQMVAYIAARWDVEVSLTRFDMHIADSMDLMRRTDVFIGVHGAGWTNSLFLSQVIRHADGTLKPVLTTAAAGEDSLSDA